MEDPIKSTSQKTKTFAIKNEDDFVPHFLEDKTGKDLSDQYHIGSSIFQRYKRIKNECLEFEKWYQRALAAALTGPPSPDDILIVVTALFDNFCAGTVQNMYSFIGTDATSPGKQFQFQNCYGVLTTTQLWKAICVSISITLGIPSNGDAFSDCSGIGHGFQVTSASRQMQNRPLSSDITGRQTGRPEGSKRSFEREKTHFALKRDAYQIEQLVCQSAKRSKVFDEFVKVNQQELYVNLFSVEGTSPEMRDNFVRVSRENALRDLMAGRSIPKEPLSGSQMDDVAEDDLNSSREHSEDSPRAVEETLKTSDNKMCKNFLCRSV